MNEAIIDVKLKSLIKVCKETKNFKKLAVVGFILTSNSLNKIGISLGIRPRNKNSDETMFKYMNMINELLNNNLKITLFKDSMLNSIKTIEIQFLKRKGHIPIEYIKEMFNIYYDLRNIEVPNLYEDFKNDFNYYIPDISSFSYFSSIRKKRKNQNINAIKPLILHKIKEEERLIREGLTMKYDKNLFENALYLKKIKSSMKSQRKSGKIEIKGKLKDNFNYQRTLDDLLGYCFLGLFVLLLLLGLVMLIETILIPTITGTLSLLFLMTFGTSALFFVIYWNYFQRK